MPASLPPEISQTGQISLFAQLETPDAFRKAVQIVHSMPKSPLSLLQRKVGNAWIKHTVENEPDAQGWWQIGIGEMTEIVGFDSNNRQYLKDAAESLMRVVFEWDVITPAAKRVQWKASVLFPEVEIHSDIIRFQVSSQMRERMISPDIYALIDMNIVRRFRRAASLAIWEFCIRFEKVGRTAEVPWESFRDMILGGSADNKTYQDYKYFKSKVISPAIAEINTQTYHQVELLETKAGRRVTMIRFEIMRKDSATKISEDDKKLEMISELVRIGVPTSEAHALIKQYNEEAVRQAIDYTQHRIADRKLAKLDNPAAYLRQALQQGYRRTDNRPAGSKSSQTTKPNSENKPIDIKMAYLAHQRNEAQRYFDELDVTEQEKLIGQYNEQQSTSTLKLGKKPSKVAKVAFFEWLATRTWGEPTPEVLLDYAQHLLAKVPEK